MLSAFQIMEFIFLTLGMCIFLTHKWFSVNRLFLANQTSENPTNEFMENSFTQTNTPLVSYLLPHVCFTNLQITFQ